jgi:hypothetical protein
MAENLQPKRAELDAKLQAVRVAPNVDAALRQAEQAVASYKDEVSGYEQQLADLDAQTGALERGRREAAERQRQERLLEQRRALVAESDRYAQHIEDAEKATRALVAALNATFESNNRMAQLARALSPNDKVPGVLNGMELVSRMAGRIAGAMGQVKGHRNRLGSIEWIGGSLYPPDRSWVEDEARRIAAGLQPLVEGAE